MGLLSFPYDIFARLRYGPRVDEGRFGQGQLRATVSSLLSPHGVPFPLHAEASTLHEGFVTVEADIRSRAKPSLLEGSAEEVAASFARRVERTGPPASDLEGRFIVRERPSGTGTQRRVWVSVSGPSPVMDRYLRRRFGEPPYPSHATYALRTTFTYRMR